MILTCGFLIIRFDILIPNLIFVLGDDETLSIKGDDHD
jgi:hypothetical protein